MATMKQIAKIAGVSRGTVDRVLNRRGSVKAETEQLILEIAKSLNYTPNEAARNLSFSKHDLKLGCILFNPEKVAFFEQIVKSIEKKSRQLQQYSVTTEIRYSDFTDPTSQDKLMDELVAQGVHGIVLCGLNLESTCAKIAELAEKGIPVITANSDIPNSKRLAYVGCDFVQAGRIGAQLINLFLKGKGNVGIVQGAYQIFCLEGRLQGFNEYLSEHAPDIHVIDIKRNNPDDFTVFSAVKDLLETHQKLDAILVDSGNSYGACRALELYTGDTTPVVITYDCYPKTDEMLKKGIITATITQQPELQGSIPLDLLLEYLAMDSAPNKQFYFTELGIKISESI